MLTKKVFLRALSLVIVTTTALSITFTGCSSKKEDGAVKTTTNQITQKPEPPGEISIFTVDGTVSQKNYPDMEIFKEIEKRLNIKINWQTLPNAGYEDALNIKLAAGDKMPEIFVSWTQTPEVLAQNGAIVALNKQYDTTMKSTKKVIDGDPALKAALTSPDGNVYYLPRRGETPTLGWQIRKDWLDKLGLKVPETTDDLIKVLEAFKDKDPNGNGKNDEVPLALRAVSYTWLYTMQNWGLKVVEPWNWVGKDAKGEFNCYLLQPKFKDVIAYINKLYTNKLLNQDLLTVSNDSYNKLISENRVGLIYDSIGNKVDIMKKANPDLKFEWAVMLPPKGPYGDRGVRTLSSFDAPTYVSAKGNVKDATRFLDYIFADPEGYDLVTYGIKGTTYEVDSKGEKVFTDLIMKNPKGLSVWEARGSMGMFPGTLPGMQNKPLKQLQEAANKDSLWIAKGAQLYNENHLWDDPEPKYRFTSKESESITNIKNKNETYVNENLAKMIVGNQSMDTWNSFVETLKKQGIEEMVTIYKTVQARTK